MATVAQVLNDLEDAGIIEFVTRDDVPEWLESQGVDVDGIILGPIDSLTDAQKDKKALDELNLMLSASEWPGASGMEDVCEVVRATGRKEVPNAPRWHSH